MTPERDGWVRFEGGELVRCIAPAKSPRYHGQQCGRWFAEAGRGLAFLVRIHPEANRPGLKPRPTTPHTAVHHCTKCDTHLEYQVAVVGAPIAAVA